MKYSIVAIIYNPNSTGPGEKIAGEYKATLNKLDSTLKVETIKTEYAGHAKDLVYDLAKKYDNPLVVSASGDGGYNELVNGAMKAQLEGYKITTGLIPAGNANDHYNSLHKDDDVYSSIKDGKSRKIDLLEMTIKSKDGERVIFAHSYIGLGLTPSAGNELNKVELNPIKELIIAAKTFFTYKPPRLDINGHVARYDNVVFSNVERMSKYLTLSKLSSVDDGKFEINLNRYKGRVKLLGYILKSSIGTNTEDLQASEFSFEVLSKAKIQADGEIVSVSGGSLVSIRCKKQILSCIV